MKALIKKIALPPAPKPTLPHRVQSKAALIDDMYMARRKAMHGHHWTQAEIDEISQMRERGMTWKEISAEFDLGEEAVRRAWTKNRC